MDHPDHENIHTLEGGGLKITEERQTLDGRSTDPGRYLDGDHIHRQGDSEYESGFF